MVRIYCSKCNTEVSKDAKFCPNCGITLSEGTTIAIDVDPDKITIDSSYSLWKLISGIVCIFFAVRVVYGSFGWMAMNVWWAICGWLVAVSLLAAGVEAILKIGKHNNMLSLFSRYIINIVIILLCSAVIPYTWALAWSIIGAAVTYTEYRKYK